MLYYRRLFPISAVCGVYLCSLSMAEVARSQSISSDGTLPTATEVNEQGNVTEITGGTARGSNLFHSFQEFSVDAGSEAFFNNANNISNILSRVTGGNISQIDGLIRANGSANLFLINPAGIIFGQGARLDLGGSFYGSTADSILFPDNIEFSATDTQAQPILTINAPIGLRLRDDPGDIVVRNNGQGVRTPNAELIDTEEALRVNSNSTLGLLGGNLIFEGATLKTPGGRIELGSVAANQTVGLTQIENGFGFDYNQVDNFRNIEADNTSTIDSSGLGGGIIRTYSNNIFLNNGSNFESSTLGSEGEGRIEMVATENVVLDGSFPTGVFVQVLPEGTSASGDINITTANLSVINGAQISVSTFGEGDAGDLLIFADDLTVDGGENGILTGLFASVESGATGQGGNIILNSEQSPVKKLSLTNGGQVITNTFGEGDGGNLSIFADDIEINGQGDFPSGLFAEVSVEAIGRGGNITLGTQQSPVEHLRINNGGQISVTTSGQGDAGTLTIYASDSIALSNSSGIFAQVFGENALGTGGNVTLNTSNLSIESGSGISVATRSQGNAGELTISASNSIDISSSGIAIAATVVEGATGDGGDVNISTNTLDLTNGAQISASTFGLGNGGNLTIDASNAINLSGSGSGIGAQAELDAVGDAGNVTLNTNNLSLSEGAFISTSTFGEGSGGELTINASNAINLSDSGTSIAASVVQGATGNAGNVTLGSEETPVERLSVSNGAFVLVNTFGEGDAGNLSIFANDLILDGGENGILTGLFASVELRATGTGGNITLGSEQSPLAQLDINNGGQVIANTFGEGDAGNLSIFAEDIEISGQGDFPSGLFAEVGAEAIGTGGNITLNTNNLNLSEGAFISTSTFGEGSGGELTINASNAINLSGSDTSIAASVIQEATGDAGNVTLNTSNLNVLNGGDISVNTDGQGNAGDLTINTGNLIVRGTGSQISASTSGDGNAGNLTINASDFIELAGSQPGFGRSGLFASARIGSGNGGDVTITTNELTIEDGATINVSNFQSLGLSDPGSGEAGNLTVNANSVRLDTGAEITAATRSGRGGNIEFNGIGDRLELRGDSSISAAAFNADGGNVTINAADGFVIAFPPGNLGNDIIANAIGGSGGDIRITAEEILGFTEGRATNRTQSDRGLDRLPNGTNDLDVSSARGAQFSGVVELNLPDIDAIQATTELPTNPVQPEQTVTQACSIGESYAQNTLIIGGRGGVPPEPTEPLDSDVLIVDGDATTAQHSTPQVIKTAQGDIVPAQGVEITEDGRVLLVAYSTSPDQRTPAARANCGR